MSPKLVAERPNTLPGFFYKRKKEREAGVGIEPTHRAFAEPCLTTWLSRRLQALSKNFLQRYVKACYFFFKDTALPNRFCDGNTTILNLHARRSFVILGGL